MPPDDSVYLGPNRPSNQRDTFCGATQSDLEHALLVDGLRRYVVRLVNHSEDRLSVACSDDVVFEEGQVLRLHMKTGCCHVQIFWVINGGNETLLGLQPTSCPDETAAGHRALSTAALLGLVACGCLFVVSHFVGYDTSWIVEKIPWASKLCESVVP